MMIPTKTPDFQYLNPVTHKEHRLWRFRSGYGLSAVRGPNVFGSDGRSWSVAVVRFNGPDVADFVVDYDNPMSRELGDVFRHTPEEQLDSLVLLASKLNGDTIVVERN